MYLPILIACVTTKREWHCTTRGHTWVGGWAHRVHRSAAAAGDGKVDKGAQHKECECVYVWRYQASHRSIATNGSPGTYAHSREWEWGRERKDAVASEHRQMCIHGRKYVYREMEMNE